MPTAIGSAAALRWIVIPRGVLSTDPLFVLAGLCGLVVASEWLVAHTKLRHLGSALLVILLGIAAANLGLLPTGTEPGNARGIYAGVFATLSRLAIFWLLLAVDLRALARAGGSMLALFLLGSGATVLGVVIGMYLSGGAGVFGDQVSPLAGMLAATYTGGSINFNAVAVEYRVMDDGVLYAGTVAIDNILTALWMVVGIVVPKWLAPRWPRVRKLSKPTTAGLVSRVRQVSLADYGALLGLGFASLWMADEVSAWLAVRGFDVPSMIVLSLLALALAQLPRRLKPWVDHAHSLGMIAVLVFLAVIGVYCDLSALPRLASLGPALLIWAATAIVVNGVCTFSAARILRFDPEMAAVASQANIGGGTSAMALAQSLGRNELVLPAILLGALGNALGTFLGFWLAGVL